MSHYDPNGYMQYKGIRDYYEQLTQNPPENVVDNLWSNILRDYFMNREGFLLLMVQAPHVPGVSKKSTGVAIRYIKNERTEPKPLILIKNKRASEETKDVSWRDAVAELTDDMILSRRNLVPTGQASETMFGIVTVGRYSRFYIMEPYQDTLMDHPSTKGALLEFQTHELDIVALLLSMKAVALRPSSSSSSDAGDARPVSRDSNTTSRPASRGSTTVSLPASSGTSL
ncbi:hypothetical protein F5144DRAFT_209002 [Chaetomium tenue]|uniref:Uncharacterized protein n=1 Tax=Chaetomium tenue TaxID=1854479 RepID=A0ACB7PGU6_9PEZI|nr:hypothetical protein F5144DRAFT_209002 [Chaetomium globosum]